jgi:hypothetical protein
MRQEKLSHAMRVLAAAALAWAGPSGAHLGRAEVTGSIGGRVIDGRDGTPLAGVEVTAQATTVGRRLPNVTTDGRGVFLIPNAPAAIYAFTLRYQDVDYPVVERVDSRAPMKFVLESCFELDAGSRTASVVRGECSSGLFSEAQVVTLEPHRFLPDLPDGAPRPRAADSPDAVAEPPPEILHTALECFGKGLFPLLRADIVPESRVQMARVYFRSDKYPDFYFVEMKLVEKWFEAVLPQPSPETARVIYYIEALDRAANNTRTEDYDPTVTDADECRRRQPKAAYFNGENPGIVVGATRTGMAAIPPGFQATGIGGFVSASGVLSGVVAGASTGGALSATGLVIIVTGGAVAGVGVPVILTGGQEASPPNTGSSKP